VSDPLLVCGADDAYAMPLAVAVRSAIDALDPALRLRVRVLDGGLSRRSRAGLLASWPAERVEVVWLRPDLEATRELPVSGHVSPAAYLRLQMPALLPDEPRAIYLDSDVVVRADLERLWEEDLGANLAIGVRDTALPVMDLERTLDRWPDVEPHVPTATPLRDWETKGLRPEDPYLNTGVLVVDLDGWRRDDVAGRVRACLAENADHAWFWDQYALNVVLAGRWGELDPRWNVGSSIHSFPSWRESPHEEASYVAQRDDPWIVHHASAAKPWRPGYPHPDAAPFFETLDRTAWTGWRPGGGLRGQWRRFRIARRLAAAESR
jgi:lipopolysaccharide biosynthesis glycosyltransferase